VITGCPLFAGMTTFCVAQMPSTTPGSTNHASPLVRPRFSLPASPRMNLFRPCPD